MNIEPLTNKINIAMGAVAALLSYLLGEHWIVFVFYLLLNCADFVTRWIAARLTGTESSKAGGAGILKKLGYWIMIAIAFGMGAIFMELGNIIGINLKVTTYIGWFVLCTLIINEIRSVLENLVEIGCPVPNVLIKGLEVANKVIDDKINLDDEDKEDEDKDLQMFEASKNEVNVKRGRATIEIEVNDDKSVNMKLINH